MLLLLHNRAIIFVFIWQVLIQGQSDTYRIVSFCILPYPFKLAVLMEDEQRIKWKSNV